MTSNAIEALYIIDHNNEIILEHVYRDRPPSARSLLPLYLAHPAPRPSLTYLTETKPPTLLFSIIHANLVFLVPASREVEPFFVLEFLHRLTDVLEEFLGAPLLTTKIESSYDVVAQLLNEICDAGSIANTEPNALRDVVEMPGWMDKLLSGVGLQGSSPSLNFSSGNLRSQFQPSLQPSPSSALAIPWRRANVKHTSNELYVDILETLSVILAPSGRPLSAIANGSILFTAKISGVPDLLLNLTVPSGRHTLSRVIELPTFHPCVRLARWKERPGELSFVPPDGKFLLAGYEVNLLPGHDWTAPTSASPKNLNIPATILVDTSLGPAGLDFEVRLSLSLPTSSGQTSIANPTTNLSSAASSYTSPAGLGGGPRSSTPTSSFFSGLGSSSSSAPSLADLSVTVPIPKAARNVLVTRASRGEANFLATERIVEWRLSSKEAAQGGTATLRCTVVGPLEGRAADIDAAAGVGLDGGLPRGFEEYDPATDEAEQAGYQTGNDGGGGGGGDGGTTPAAAERPSKAKPTAKSTQAGGKDEGRDMQRVDANRALMPRSAAASFSVKGWLASGLRVESLNVDVRRSRGLGEGVKPVKGVKYLCVSRGGVETRC